MSFTFCPRCDERAYQHFKTHAFCIECNYSPALDGGEDEPMIPAWALEALRNGGRVTTPEDEIEEVPIKILSMSTEVANAKSA